MEFFLSDDFLRNSKTFLQLGDVEDIVDGCKLIGQLELVGDGSTLLEDLVWADEARASFPLTPNLCAPLLEFTCFPRVVFCP